MIIVTTDLRSLLPPTLGCTRCHKRRPLQRHHIEPRGMGSGRRLDIRINLVLICQDCHDWAHADRKKREARLVAIVARRDRFPAECWRPVIDFFLHLPGDPWQKHIDDGLAGLKEPERVLAVKSLKEAGL